MIFDYLNDPIGIVCLEMARQCRTNVGFGAVLFKNGKIIGKGRNRLATKEDRLLIPHTDYAIHSEQDCVADALRKGYDVVNTNVYVLGICLHGKNRGCTYDQNGRHIHMQKVPSRFYQV